MGTTETIIGLTLSLIVTIPLIAIPTYLLCRSHLGRIIEIVGALVLYLCKGIVKNWISAMIGLGFDQYFLFHFIWAIIEIPLFVFPIIGVILFVIELISIINLAMPYLPKPVRLTITIIGILLVALISFATVQLVGIVPVGYAIASALKSWNNDKNK